MLERRWSYEGGTAVDTRDADSTTRLDVRELVRKAGGRRPGARGVELSERDVICATALAANQSSAQAPSVLDVDATSLRIPKVKVPREAPEGAQWTPPVLAVDEPLALEASTTAAAEADLRDQLRRDRRAPGRKALAGALALGLTGLLGGGLFFTLSERGDASLAQEAQPVTAAAAAVPDPALLPADGLEGPAAPAAEQAVTASVEGVLDITSATVREDLGGQPGEPATSFPTGRAIGMWLDFEYVERESDDTLGVVWFRDGTELTRSDFDLTAGRQTQSVTGPALDQPGAYRAEVRLNDQVLTTAAFDVTAP